MFERKSNNSPSRKRVGKGCPIALKVVQAYLQFGSESIESETSRAVSEHAWAGRRADGRADPGEEGVVTCICCITVAVSLVGTNGLPVRKPESADSHIIPASKTRVINPHDMTTGIESRHCLGRKKNIYIVQTVHRAQTGSRHGSVHNE